MFFKTRGWQHTALLILLANGLDNHQLTNQHQAYLPRKSKLMLFKGFFFNFASDWMVAVLYCQRIWSQIWKSLFTRMDFNMDIY